jgi:hypothetical protein
MQNILLGHDCKTGQAVYLPVNAMKTHLHLIGGTGKGKTTALHTMLHPLMLDPFDEACFFVFDRLGNFSQELLMWMASDFCTEDVRKRLLYVEPAREDVVLGFNPLVYTTDGEGFYKVSRATDIVLRAWESVNIEAMPRLARWTFNAFYAAAQLGLTIADCVHFLMPGSPYHGPLLEILPERLRYEWEELMHARSGEAMRILESSRNRLKPYFESDILRRMFGVTKSRLDVERFMRERKIVVLNLAPGNRLSTQLSDAIGALVLNEVLATARSLPRGVRYPTYLVLDEFQNFVGPDIEAALPEVRQLGLRLLLSHQSFSQLKRGDYDLISMIFQAQSRMIFGVQGEDADLVAQELASITFDPKRIKDELYTRRQLVTGQRIVDLSSWSEAESQSRQWTRDYGRNWSTKENLARRADAFARSVYSEGRDQGTSEREGQGGGSTESRTRGGHQTLTPEYEQFLELSTRSYYSFDEQRSLWAQAVRNCPTGVAYLRLVDDPRLHEIMVKRSTPGHLAWDMETLLREFPEALEETDRLVEENFRSDFFVSPEVIDQEVRERLHALLQPKLTIQTTPVESRPVVPEKEGEPTRKPDPFL